MAYLITESNFDILTEQDSKKNLYITGLYSSAEKKNQNGRLYPKSLLEREVGRLKEESKQGGLIGELSHPENRAESLLKEAAVCTEDLWWEGNNVMGRSRVLQNTPNGWILKGLIEDKVGVGVSSRGLGTVNENGTVNEDFHMICYDLVSNPSNFGSWVNGVLEGKEFDLPGDKKTTNKYTYEDVKKYLSENHVNFLKDIDPLKLKELLDEGYSPDIINDILAREYKEREKVIFQILENLTK